MLTARQHVQCETCGEVFLDMDAWEYVKVSRCYANRGRRPNIDWQAIASLVQQNNGEAIVAKANSVVEEEKGFYDKFFCKAVIHWCNNPDHTIMVSVPLGDNGVMQRYDMTYQFKDAFITFGSEYLVNQKSLMEAVYDEGAII